jgi:hypothetical protein
VWQSTWPSDGRGRCWSVRCPETPRCAPGAPLGYRLRGAWMWLRGMDAWPD